MNTEIVKLREVITKLIPLLTGKGLAVTQRGSQAYVDIDLETRRPKSVNIPNIPDTATPDFVRAISGFIDHEVGHVLFTDYDVFGKDIRDKRDAEDPKKAALHNLHNMMEDTFIEREIVEVFPGSKRNLADLREHFLRKVTAPALAKAADEKEAFSYLMVPAVRALAGQPEFVEFMDAGKHWDQPLLKDLLDRLPDDKVKLLKTAKNSTQTLEIAQAIYDVVFEEPPEGQSQDKPDQQAGPGNGKGERKHDKNQKGDPSEGSAGGKPEKGDGEAEGGSSADKGDESEEEKDDKSEGGAGGDGDYEEEGEGKDKGDESEDEADEGDEEDSDEESDEEGDQGEQEEGDDEKEPREEQESKADASFTSEFVEAEGGEGDGIGSSDQSASMFDLQHDIFDGKDLGSEIGQEISDTAIDLMREQRTWKAFTREFDVVEPLQPTHVGKNWVPDMEEETAKLTSRMQKDIERMLASQNWVIQTPGHRKGKLHTPSLYKMGLNAGEDRVFKQRQEHNSTNTAVTLLVDNSGSMHGNKCRLAMVASYALSSTLERVKINHEVIGFTTGHYSHSAELNEALRREHEATTRKGVHYDRTVPLVMPIYKAFGERISPEVKRRFAFTMNAQAGLAGNIDGESLQIASERLVRQPEKRKVILVLSDGQPAGGTNSGPHLKAVVKDLNKSGIETIGIGIMDQSVRHYYEKHIVLSNVNDLPNQVMSELRKILSA